MISVQLIAVLLVSLSLVRASAMQGKNLLTGKAHRPAVLVVGAGLSGLSAAAKLIENGYEDVVILEAENRIGGRVLSDSFAGGVIDLGAQFVHGEKGNAIFEMVNPHSELKQLKHSELDFDYFNSKGEAVDQKSCYAIDKELSELMNILPETRNESVGHLMTRKAQENLQRFGDELGDQMISLFEKQSNINFASKSWDDVSTFYKRYKHECKGNQMILWRDGSFSKVLGYVMKKLPSSSKRLDVESKVLLNKEVSNINWRDNDQVHVSCADGSTYSADHVIVTTSLGVLKDRHESFFTPRLPEKKVKAIESIGFGAIGKIYLQFAEPFWPSDEKWFGYSFLWKDDDLNAVKGTNREWLLGVMVVIRVVDNPTVLQAFICPKYLETFEEISDEKLFTDLMWAMEKFLGRDLPKAIDVRRTKWLSNRNFLGTSSFYSMESENKNSTPKDLAEPLRRDNNKPLVLFAGEATHEKFSGSSHGAVESGWRAAEEILEFLRDD